MDDQSKAFEKEVSKVLADAEAELARGEIANFMLLKVKPSGQFTWSLANMPSASLIGFCEIIIESTMKKMLA